MAPVWFAIWNVPGDMAYALDSTWMNYTVLKVAEELTAGAAR
jgi:hypothetical protein